MWHFSPPQRTTSKGEPHMSEHASIAGSITSRKLETKETIGFRRPTGSAWASSRIRTGRPRSFRKRETATDRRHRRIACSFKVRNDGRRADQHHGDMSRAGALRAHPASGHRNGGIMAGEGLKARAEIIATSAPSRATSTGRFLDPARRRRSSGGHQTPEKSHRARPRTPTDGLTAHAVSPKSAGRHSCFRGHGTIVCTLLA